MSNFESHRYYRIEPNSHSFVVLDTIENAGLEILKAFQSIEPLKDKGELLRVTSRNHMIGYTVLPTAGTANQIPAPVLQSTRQRMADEFRKRAPELLRTHQFRIIAVDIPGPDPVTPLFSAEPFVPSICAIHRNHPIVATERNIAIRLNEASELTRHPNKHDPSKGVLSIDGHSFYPQARNIFATWVLQLPPVIPQIGNTYEPPKDCIPMDKVAFTKLVGTAAFEDFRANHHAARERLLGLKTLEVS